MAWQDFGHEDSLKHKKAQQVFGAFAFRLIPAEKFRLALNFTRWFFASIFLEQVRNMNRKILSICLSGRNDDYGTDFKRRFVQSVNFLAWSARRAAVLQDLGILFCDWNSAFPLAEELRFSPEAASILRFIQVPPEVAEPLNYGQTPFHTAKSLNVALRRARGKFVAMMPSDILFSQFALRALLALLKAEVPLPFDPEKSLLGVPRKFLPAHVDERTYFSSCEKTEQLLANGDWYMENDRYTRAMNGGYGMWILPAAELRKTRGLLESIGGWGYSDSELGMRLADKLPVVNLSGYAVFCYDFAISISEYRRKNKGVRFELTHFSADYEANPENWGLAEQVFLELPAKIGDVLPQSDYEAKRALGQELLWYSRVLPAEFCPGFSRLAACCLFVITTRQVRKVLFCGCSDISAIVAAALLDPLLEITVVDSSENNVTRFQVLDLALRESGHLGRLHYSLLMPQAEQLQGMHMMVLQDLECSESATLCLSAGAAIVSLAPVKGLEKEMEQKKGFFFYNCGSLETLGQELKEFYFSGNFLLRRSISRQFVRLWNSFSHIPFRRWLRAIKSLRQTLSS